MRWKVQSGKEKLERVKCEEIEIEKMKIKEKGKRKEIMIIIEE